MHQTTGIFFDKLEGSVYGINRKKISKKSQYIRDFILEDIEFADLSSVAEFD